MTDIQKTGDNLLVVENLIINDAVKYINEKIGNDYYKTAIDVGSYVLMHFFHDNIAEVKSKSSNKEHSFNRLCENSDLQVHPKHLYQMVMVAAQERLLISNLKTDQLSKLGYSLKVELLKINVQKTKIDFAKHFIKNSYTVKQAKEYIKNKLGYDPTFDIIPFSNPLIEQFNKISNWSQHEDTEVDYSKLSAYKAKTINDNIDSFLKLIDQIDQVKKKLLERKAMITERETELLKESEAKEKKTAEKAAAKANKAVGLKNIKVTTSKTKRKTQVKKNKK